LADSGLDVEVLVSGTGERRVESTVALVVASAHVVDQVESITESDATRILTSSRDGVLALAGLEVEVVVSSTGRQSVDSVSALVVVSAQVVDQVESVGLSNTFGVLASNWDAGLALSGLEVVVLVGGTVEAAVESVVALVVRLAQVVQQVESVGDVGATRILASSGYCRLASSGGDVEVLVGGTGECGVESVLALVVASAYGVGQVESVLDVDTSWVLASGGDGSLALSGLEVEVLVGTTRSLAVSSVVTLVVVVAEVVLQVESGGLSSASWLGDDDVGEVSLLTVQTGTQRFHAHSHLEVVTGLDPGNQIVVGESVVAFVAQGVVLGGHDDGGNWQVGVVLGEGQVSADSWHGVSESVELSWECDVSNLWDEWWQSVLNQQPFETDVLMKTIEVLEFTGAETDGGGSVAA